MLVSLHVKNLALIDETEVFFGEGLNILTGETGAGKSIILGSIHLALGGKADKNLIRTGADYALVELLFQVDKEEQLKKLHNLEIPMENELLIIQRRIMPSRSVCKINGELVSNRQLKEIASLFINIHGQHENQSLLNEKKYSEILDDFCIEKIQPIKTSLKKLYQEYVEATKELENITTDDATRVREIALAAFEIEEIEKAQLQIGEDEEIDQKYTKVIHAKKIVEALTNAHLWTGYEDDHGAGSQIGRALRELKTVVSYDADMEQLDEQLVDIDNLLNDFNRAVSAYVSDLEFDQNDFQILENRLNVINHLKSKYGHTIDEVLEYQAMQQEKLEKLSHYEEYILKCREKVETVKEKIWKESAKASKIRSTYAITLSSLLTQALKELNFIEVDFEIQVLQKETVISPEGYDDIKFMISTNPGEPKKLMSSVASGGELSRIMLALKSVLADKEQIDTLIFDEIDAGISGITAWKVSEKMAVLAKQHQIICITHLPQIAAMADSHYLIEKSSSENITRTDIKELKDDAILVELARLLGGTQITEVVLANAKEMKDLAIKQKNN
ncbi:MAG: DNA repair protein RecN [Eubacteriales bacterium]